MVFDHLHSILQMVRTRATTAPIPAPVGQGASEQATGDVARGRVAQEAVEEVVGGRPLEEEDKHLSHLVLGW